METPKRQANVDESQRTRTVVESRSGQNICSLRHTSGDTNWEREASTELRWLLAVRIFRQSCKESVHPRQMGRPRTFDASHRR